MVQETYLSVIIPVYNEEENVPLLHTGIMQVLTQQDIRFEIVYIDDGSSDGTFVQLQRLAKRDPEVHVVRLRRNFGQTAAMSAGVAQSCGKILVFMDGDLQNDPLDIPRLVSKLEEGYDVVSGWRKDRKDAHLSRKVPSMIANRLIANVTGVKIHDTGCSLKAYRREIFEHLKMYGEMHRFLPAYAALGGAAITEIEVQHHARKYGKSKYGISRTVRVILDLLTLKFLGSYGTKPLYAFGMPGLVSLSLGGILAILVGGQRVMVPGARAHRNPLLSIALLFSGFGMQCMMVGLLAEVLMRTYHESQDKPIYVVRDVVSLATAEIDERYLDGVLAGTLEKNVAIASNSAH